MRAGLMPPAGMPRPDAAQHEAFLGWLEGQLGSGGAGQSESRPQGAVPPAEPHRIPQRRARSARPRSRRHRPAAGRRFELRLRQHRRRAQTLAHADGALPWRGAQDQPYGRGHARAVPHGGLLPRRRRSLTRKAACRCRRPARAAGRRSLHLPDGRAMHLQGGAAARSQRTGAAAARTRRTSRSPSTVRVSSVFTLPGVAGAARRRARAGTRAGSRPTPTRRPRRSARETTRDTALPDAAPRVSKQGQEQRNRIDRDWEVTVPVKAGTRDVQVAFLKGRPRWPKRRACRSCALPRPRSNVAEQRGGADCAASRSAVRSTPPAPATPRRGSASSRAILRGHRRSALRDDDPPHADAPRLPPRRSRRPTSRRCSRPTRWAAPGHLRSGHRARRCCGCSCRPSS